MNSINLRILFTSISLLLIILSILGIFFVPTLDLFNSNCSITGSVQNDLSISPIQFSNGQKHTIELDEVEDLNLFTDFLPVINDPRFIEIREVEYLQPDDLGIGVVINNDARFYPLRILIWHNNVNDCVGDIPVVVSYCPLCQVGIAYNRQVGDTILDFRVSDDVWLGNIMLYDIQTNSRWSTVLGESVIGDYSGIKLEQVPTSLMTYEQWEKIHPNSLVLSENTGFDRDYHGNIDYSPSIIEGYSIQELKSFILVIPDADKNTMHPLLSPGESIVDTNNNISIEFTEEKPIVKINDYETDDYLVIPLYIWKSAHPNAIVQI
jgi:hypothetical protein